MNATKYFIVSADDFGQFPGWTEAYCGARVRRYERKTYRGWTRKDSKTEFVIICPSR